MIARARATLARTIVAFASVAVTAAIAPPIRASSARGCGVDRAWIFVRIAIDAPLTASERRGLVDDLAVELGGRGVDVCAAADTADTAATSRAIAKLAISISPTDATLVRLTIDDALTGKSTTRDVSLRDVPRVAWSPSLSLAARELLRASWAELSLTPPTTPPPPIVPAPIAADPTLARSIARDVGPTSAPARASSSLALTAEAARFGADLTLFGGRARASLAIVGPVSLSLGFGAASSIAVEASDGRVVATSLFAHAGLDVLLTSPASRARLSAVARVDVARLALHASSSSSSDATAHDATATLLAPIAGLRASLSLGAHVGVVIEADGGPILRGARGLDAGALVVDVRGAVVAFSTGFEGTL